MKKNLISWALLVGTVALATGAALAKEPVKEPDKAPAAAPKITITLPGDLKFAGVAPNAPVQAAILWGDPVKGPVGFFLKVPAGTNSGLHKHSGDYRAVVVQGVMTASDTDDPKAVSLPVGSYYVQPGGQFHNNVCRSTTDCLLYIEFINAGIDTTPKDPPKAAKAK